MNRLDLMGGGLSMVDACARLQAAYAERRKAWREAHPIRDVNEPPVEPRGALEEPTDE